MRKASDDDLIGPAEAGRLLGVSRERVRQLVAAGRLPAMRGPYGWRMVPRAAVLRLAKERERGRTPR